MVVRIEMTRQDFTKERGLYTSEYTRMVSKEGVAGRTTYVEMCEPQAWGAYALPEIHLVSEETKDCPRVNPDRHVNSAGGGFIPTAIRTEIAGKTVSELMNALIECPETFAYIAEAVVSIASSKTLGNGKSAEDHLSAANRQIATGISNKKRNQELWDKMKELEI